MTAQPPSDTFRDFAFKPETLRELHRHLEAESVEHVRLACALWLSPSIPDDSQALRDVIAKGGPFLAALERLNDETFEGLMLSRPYSIGVLDTLIHSSDKVKLTRGFVASILAGAEHYASRHPQEFSRGRPASDDWLLAGWIGAVCLGAGIQPSAGDGPFAEVMTAAWYAVGRTTLPTHAVREMLKKVRRGEAVLFPAVLGSTYLLFAKNRKLYCRFEDLRTPKGMVLSPKLSAFFEGI